MITVAPDYYRDFHCIADKCRHSCCVGWEIEVDPGTLPRFLNDPFVSPHIACDAEGNAQIALLEGDRCPFLRADGLCEMIVRNGEDSLCGICRDHPRFRSFWTGRVELGLGLVCEEAARLILGRDKPTSLVVIDDDGEHEQLPPDEEWLLEQREQLIDNIEAEGPIARFTEYLMYRHLPDALYDGLVEERMRFIDDSIDEIKSLWAKTSGTLEELIEIVRVWSYNTEYDDEVIPARLEAYRRENDAKRSK